MAVVLLANTWMVSRLEKYTQSVVVAAVSAASVCGEREVHSLFEKRLKAGVCMFQDKVDSAFSDC